MQRNRTFSAALNILKCSVINTNQPQNGFQVQFFTVKFWEWSGMCRVEENGACMLERSHQDRSGYNRVIFIISQLKKKTSMWVWFVDSCGGPCICSTRRAAAASFQTDTFPAKCRVRKIFQIRLEFLCFTQQKQIPLDMPCPRCTQREGLASETYPCEFGQIQPPLRRQEPLIISCNCNRPVRS